MNDIFTAVLNTGCFIIYHLSTNRAPLVMYTVQSRKQSGRIASQRVRYIAIYSIDAEV